MNDDSLQLLNCIQGMDVASESIADVIKSAAEQRAKENQEYANLVQLKNHLKTHVPSVVSNLMPDISGKVKDMADKFNFTDERDYKFLNPAENAKIDYDEKDVYIGELTVVSFKGDKCNNGYLEQRYNKIGYKTYKDYTNAIRKFKNELIDYISKIVVKKTKKNHEFKFRVFENDSEIKIFVYDDGYCKKYLESLKRPPVPDTPLARECRPVKEAAATVPAATKAELSAIVKNVTKAYGINAREWKKEIMVIMARYGLSMRNDYTYATTMADAYLDTKTGRIFFPIIAINEDAPIIYHKRCDALREVNNYLSENLDILEETYPNYTFRTKAAIVNGVNAVLLIIKSKY